MTYRAFLLDDHEVVRRGMAALLSLEDDFTIVGEAATATEALELIAVTVPDVAVLDVRLGEADDHFGGIEVCRDIKSAHPTVNCLMVTSFDDDEALFAAIMAGASGYVLKRTSGAELVDAMRRAARGENLLDPVRATALIARAREPVIDEPSIEALTERERDILEYVAQGMTNRQIGEALYLAEKTIKNYMSSILLKLGMVRRSQAAAYAARLSERHREVPT